MPDQTRLERIFSRLKTQKRTAFMPYICCGDPSYGFTKKLIKTLVESGADCIEFGIPFSDPVADGPTIQKASERSLKTGMTPPKAIRMIKELREEGIEVPIVVMTYYNIVFVNEGKGQEDFVERIKKAGADGLIVPDVPIEESGGLEAICKNNRIDLIRFIAPTTPEDRLSKIVKNSSGFLYIVAVAGTTGARQEISKGAVDLISKARLIRKEIPLVVGFGVSKPEHIKEYVKAGADGVIVGSKFVDIYHKMEGTEEQRLEKVAGFTRDMLGKA